MKILLLILVLCVIGLPLWILGCNPDVKNGCLTKFIKTGNLNNKFTTINHDEGSIFHVVHFEYLYSNNLKCEYISPNYADTQSAEKELNKFSLNSEMKIIIRKNNKSLCTYKINESKIMWIFGVIILFLTLVLIIIFSGYLIYIKYFKVNKNLNYQLVDLNFNL